MGTSVRVAKATSMGQTVAEGFRAAINRDLLVGAQPPPGRQLRHSLAAAQQDPARNDGAGGGLPAAGKDPDG